jgi:transposase
VAEDRRPRGRPDRPGLVNPAPGGGGDLKAENRELRKRTKQLEQENEILRRATAYFARDTLPK